MRTTLPWALALALALAGCSGDKPSPAPSVAAARATLRPVSPPSLEGVEPALQERIRARYTALSAARERGNVSDAELANAYGEVGKLLVASELFDQAEPHLLNAQLLAPRDLAWPYYLGHLNRLRNAPDKSVPFFETVLTLEPDYVPALVWLGTLELDRGQPARAEPLLRKAVMLQPASAAARFGLGRLVLSRRDYAEAVKQFEAALAADPGANTVQYALAQAYRGLGDLQRAELHMRRWKDEPLYPDDPLMAEIGESLKTAVSYQIQGTRALDERKWPEAVAFFRKGVEVAPRDATLHQNLGTALYLSGDTAGAQAQFEEAVRLLPAYARAQLSLGLVLEGRGEDQAAIDRYTEALKLDPDLVNARFSLADALRRTGRVDASIPHYQQIVADDPEASQAQFGLAMAYVRLRRYREARATLEDAATRHPDQPGFAHALARVLAAAPDDGVRDGARALALVTTLQKTYPTAAVLETSAMALAEVGRFKEAAARQREAMTLATRQGAADAARRMRENLRLYEANTPCRQPWRDDDPVHFPRAAGSPGTVARR